MEASFLNSFWTQLFLGSEDYSFITDVILRTVIMFLIIITGLRLLGKRGVKQLSVFELVVIIGLGSAAGDPMFYKEVGILFSLIVFIIIIALYALLTYFLARSKKFENLLEGTPIVLIKNGVFEIEHFKKETLGSDEFFAELRLKGISHLGQVESAIEETSGEVSVFFMEDHRIQYGLPVLPGSLKNPLTSIYSTGYYACVFCGFTEKKEPGAAGTCTNCGKKHWVPASNKKRVS